MWNSAIRKSKNNSDSEENGSAVITRDYENNGYNDNLNKYALYNSRYHYTLEYTQLTTL
jgi:hypothetical protein